MDKIFKWTALFIVLVILAVGGVAFYTVFLADEGMTMPSYREMSLIDAVADAEQLGMNVRIEQMESNLPTGRVLTQWPEAGAKIRGADKNVIFKVSKGGERRPIPDIRGIELTAATRMLEDQGFTVGDIIRVKDSSNSGFPAGSVIAQNPASPASVPINNRIDLLVSEGSEDGRFALPNVSNMTEAAAKGIISNAGLRVLQVEKEKNRNRNVLEGQVSYTRPAAGSMVKKGDGVRLFISIGEGAPAVAQTAIPGRAAGSVEPDLTDASLPGRGTASSNGSDLVRPETTPAPQRPGPASQQNNPHSPEFNLPGTSGNAAPPAPAATGQPASPAVPAPATPATPAPAAGTGNKVARVRYQVPPVLRPLPLRIEIVDPQGTRVLLERNARANETVQVEGRYSQEAVVSIWLGGEFVWQERYN